MSKKIYVNLLIHFSQNGSHLFPVHIADFSLLMSESFKKVPAKYRFCCVLVKLKYLLFGTKT